MELFFYFIHEITLLTEDNTHIESFTGMKITGLIILSVITIIAYFNYNIGLTQLAVSKKIKPIGFLGFGVNKLHLKILAVSVIFIAAAAAFFFVYATLLKGTDLTFIKLTTLLIGIIAGLYLIFRLYLLTPALIYTNTLGYAESWKLTKGHMLRLFGFVLIITLIMMGISLVLSLPDLYRAFTNPVEYNSMPTYTGTFIRTTFYLFDFGIAFIAQGLIYNLKVNNALWILFLGVFICFPFADIQAKPKCFIVTEKEKIIHKTGDCHTRYAPCSTFKVAISLMGYDDGFLANAESPKLLFKEGYIDWLDLWKQPHTPKLWLKNSCVWYSQIITKHLGTPKFQNYVNALNYGNQNVSGDIGKNNGLTHCWLSSSLKISAQEQTQFLKKLLNNKLPVSQKAHDMTKQIMFVEDLDNGWKLYGKTGNGRLLADDQITKLDRQIGWFVGWIEKADRQIIFTYLIVDEDKQDIYASFRAKDAVKAYMKKITRTC